jgi:hypothetical protein
VYFETKMRGFVNTRKQKNTSLKDIAIVEEKRRVLFDVLHRENGRRELRRKTSFERGECDRSE